MTEIERIKNAGGFVKDGRLNGILSVSRSFGDKKYKTSNKSKDPKDFLITCNPDI